MENIYFLCDCALFVKYFPYISPIHNIRGLFFLICFNLCVNKAAFVALFFFK